MLIKCPECGKEISDKSKQCIHCGYPLKSNHTCIINGKEYDLSFVFDENYSYLYKVRDFVQITHCDIPTARQYIDKFIEDESLPKYVNIEPKQQNNSTTKCPRCGNTTFTPMKKKWSILAGFATNQVELVCNNCGYKMKAK